MGLPIILRLERLSRAAVPPQRSVAGGLLLGELGEVDLALVDLVTQLVKALRPIRTVGVEVVEGLEGKLDVLRDARRVPGRTSRRSC